MIQDVLDAISHKRKWNNQDVQVTNLDLEKAEYAILNSYDVSLRLGPASEFAYKLKDSQVSKWKKFGDFGGGDFESLVDDLSFKGVVDEFQIKGPFELRASGDDRFQLMLPVFFLYASFCFSVFLLPSYFCFTDTLCLFVLLHLESLSYCSILLVCSLLYMVIIIGHLKRKGNVWFLL